MQITAIAQRLNPSGFQVTFELMGATPELMNTAAWVIHNTPGCWVVSTEGNRIVAQSSLPWELLMHLANFSEIGGFPFQFVLYMNCATASLNISDFASPADIAQYLAGRKLAPISYN